jgi:hypothetical protein
MRRITLIAASTLALASQALAQDADPKPADAAQTKKEPTEEELIKARTAQITAETAMIVAQSAKVKAKMEALGLTPATGTTTLNPGAGQIEAQMLAVGSLNAAAVDIVRDLEGKNGDHPIAALTDKSHTLLLDGNQAINLSLPEAIKADIKTLQSALRVTGVDPECLPAVDTRGRLPVAGALPIIGAVLSLLRTDTTISAITLTPSETQLMHAVATKLPGKAIILDDLASPVFAGSDLSKAIDALDESITVAARRSALLGCGDETNKAKAAVLNAAIAQAERFRTAITKSDDTDPSLLSTAIKFEAVAKPGMKLLRLYTEALGGSMLKRSNVWTALGAPAVGLTSGLVISYRLSDPATGSVEKAGVLVCRTALTNMREVQAGRARESKCGVTIPPETPPQ